MDSFYSEKAGFETSRHDSSISMSRAMRSMKQHEMADRTNCISPEGEIDGKRNPQRRRVPVAVCTHLPFLLRWKLILLVPFSVVDADDERSSVAEIPAMARDAPTAVVLEIRTVSSYE